MISYIKKTFQRKIARRVTREYSYKIDKFELERDGCIEFANWKNPLVHSMEITQSEIDFYRKFITRGDTVIDIGANIGDTTVPIAIASGKEGTTLAFDPNPYVFKILEINASLNKSKTNIIPIANAISTEEQDYYFASSEASFANGGISLTRDYNHGRFVYPHKIKGINLTDLLNKNYKNLLKRLSFIKIDAEGYDKEIIKSISKLLAEYKPSLIAESFEESTHEEKMELFEVIHKHGYRIFYFEEFKDKTKTQEITKAEEMTNWKETFNIYAIPNKKGNKKA